MATLDDLQAAFNGESNARAKYLVFAKQADQEGYAPVASLFRAAAAAEEIHATNHANVIRKLGATPKVEIAPVPPATTRQNLPVAIQGESYERDVMYPGFIKTAKAAGQKQAIRTFEFALAAETEHAKLYQQALDGLEGQNPRKGAKRDFWVCPVCGYTTATAPGDKCPVCGAKKEAFKVVN